MDEPEEFQADPTEAEDRKLEDQDYGREQLQKPVFPWVTFQDEKSKYQVNPSEHETTTAFEVAARYGVPEEVVTGYLHKEIQESESCWSLPFTLLLVVSYTGMMLTHLSQPEVYTVEYSLVNNIEENANFAFTSQYIGHKNVYDVHSWADFWSWMNHGLVPLLFIQEPEISERSRFEDPLSPDPRLDPSFGMQRLMTDVNGSANGTDADPESEVEVPIFNETNETEPPPYLNYSRVWQGFGRWIQGWSYTYQEAYETLVFNGTNGTENISNITLGPLLFKPEPDDTRRGRNVLLHYNNIVGGLRLRQERSKGGDVCPEEFLPFYGRSCAGGIGYELEPVESEARSTEEDPTKTVWLFAHDDLAETHLILHQLEAEGWLDERTMKIEIGLPTYNTEYNLHTLVTINFFFARGGHIWKVIIPSSVFANFWDTGSVAYVYDILWLLCLAYIILAEGWEIFQTVKFNGFRGIWTEYIGFWNSVDWVSVGAGLGIIGTAVASYLQLLELNNTLEVLGQTIEDRDQEKYRSLSEEYTNKLWEGAQVTHMARVLYACYPFVIGMRLLKAFDAQPRLGMLTRTLVKGGSDIVHFMLVFLSILAAFATAGVLCFGREVQEFATFERAFISCTRAMMGDFEWEELVQVGRIEAGVWFVSFMVIVTLLMFNIIVAILMDAYGTVQASLQRADTLWTELLQAYTRWIGYQKGELVPMREVLTTIQQLHEDLPHLIEHARHIPVQMRQKNQEMPVNDARLESVQDKNGEVRLITVEFLKDHVVKMRTKQAQELLEDCVLFFYYENKEDMDIGDVMRMVHDTDHDTSELHGDLREICRRINLKLADSDLDGPKHHHHASHHHSAKHEEEEAQEDARLQAVERQVRNDFEIELDLCRQELSTARMWIGVTAGNLHKETVTVTKVDPEKLKEERQEAERDVATGLQEAEDKVEGAKATIRDIIHKLEVARQTKREAVQAIAEMEAQLLDLTDEVADVNMELIGMRSKLLDAKNDRKRIVEEAKRWQQEAGKAKSSQQECLDLTRSLFSDNQALKQRLTATEQELHELQDKIKHNDRQVEAAMKRTVDGRNSAIQGFTAMMKQLQVLEDVMEKERAGASLAGMDLSRFPVDDLYDTVDEGKKRFMQRIAKHRQLR